MTTELIARDITWARKITERIKIDIDSAAGALDRLSTHVIEAFEGRADREMGYESWSAYADAEFSARTRDLAPHIRRDLVAALTDRGLSTSAQAPVLGVTPQAINRTQHRIAEIEVSTQVETSRVLPDPGGRFECAACHVESGTDSANRTPVGLLCGECERNRGALNTPTMMQVNPDTGVVEDVPARHITGIDGKSYSVPTQKRRPEPKSETDSGTVAFINDLRGPWSRGITKTAAQMTPQARSLLIDALQSTLDQIREIHNEHGSEV